MQCIYLMIHKFLDSNMKVFLNILDAQRLFKNWRWKNVALNEKRGYHFLLQKEIVGKKLWVRVYVDIINHCHKHSQCFPLCVRIFCFFSSTSTLRFPRGSWIQYEKLFFFEYGSSWHFPFLQECLGGPFSWRPEFELLISKSTEISKILIHTHFRIFTHFFAHAIAWYVSRG